MSDIDQFLLDIQLLFGDGRIFKVYGDCLFPLLNCIICAHYGNLINPMTDEEKLQNSGMKSVRVNIENDFSTIANKWSACSSFSSFKLGGENPHAQEQLAICYLLSNISLCLHGNQVGGLYTFICMPPTLEQYLAL